jgi:hypothetical protein
VQRDVRDHRLRADDAPPFESRHRLVAREVLPTRCEWRGWCHDHALCESLDAGHVVVVVLCREEGHVDGAHRPLQARVHGLRCEGLSVETLEPVEQRGAAGREVGEHGFERAVVVPRIPGRAVLDVPSRQGGDAALQLVESPQVQRLEIVQVADVVLDRPLAVATARELAGRQSAHGVRDPHLRAAQAREEHVDAFDREVERELAGDPGFLHGAARAGRC